MATVPPVLSEAAAERGARKQALVRYCRMSSQCWHFTTGLRFSRLDFTRSSTWTGQCDLPTRCANNVPVTVRWFVIGVLRRLLCSVRITSQEGWPKNTSVQTMYERRSYIMCTEVVLVAPISSKDKQIPAELQHRSPPRPSFRDGLAVFGRASWGGWTVSSLIANRKCSVSVRSSAV